MHSVTLDIGSFTEDFPDDIRKRIHEHYRQTAQHPKYVLLGRKERRYLHLEFTRERYFTIFAIDHTNQRETFYGVEILPVDRDSFIDIV